MSAAQAAIELAAGEASARICPAIGGAVARLRWRGRDVLRPAPDEAIAAGQVRAMGCFPLVPYSNRIVDARLAFDGHEHALRPNFPPEPHAIHGVGWRRAWQVEEAAADRVRLALRHDPDPDWPFAFEAREEIVLTGASLSLALSIESRDPRAMPAGLGFHPYFPLTPGLTLEARWDDRDADFSRARPIGEWRVDRNFAGWAGSATLDDGELRTTLRAPPPLDRLVVYAPQDGRGFIALEPVSHATDAFNLAARGLPATGTRVLAPGERWSASAAIAFGAAAR